DQITPDLVLMDALMPGMDGFETCRRLKNEKLLSHVPVGFMTGLSETEHVVQGLAAGIEQLKQLRQPSAKASTRLEIGPRRIELSFLSSIGPDELLFRLAEVIAGGDEQLLQQTLQLTSREAEGLL